MPINNIFYIYICTHGNYNGVAPVIVWCPLLTCSRETAGFSGESKSFFKPLKSLIGKKESSAPLTLSLHTSPMCILFALIILEMCQIESTGQSSERHTPAFVRSRSSHCVSGPRRRPAVVSVEPRDGTVARRKSGRGYTTTECSQEHGGLDDWEMEEVRNDPDQSWLWLITVTPTWRGLVAPLQNPR